MTTRKRTTQNGTDRNVTGKRPLRLHKTGQWCKQICGQVRYFGTDYDLALAKYVEERADWEAGRNPRKQGLAAKRTNYTTLAAVADAFMVFKEQQRDEGSLSNRQFKSYLKTCERLVSHFGKGMNVETLTAADFAQYRTTFPKWAPTSIGREIRETRSVFKFAWDMELISSPIRFGPVFKDPNKAVKRKYTNQKEESRGLLEFTAEECHQLIAASPPHFKAMTLLALNCGFGNMDCALLARKVVDLEGRWISYARNKNGIKRKCYLWAETVAALQVATEKRKDPKDPANADLYFLTGYGNPWVRSNDKSEINAISQQYSKLIRKCGLVRKDRAFYSLRRTFETIAGNLGEQIAVDLIMGHGDEAMSAVYRQRVFDEKLIAVSDHMHGWLFG